MWWRRLTKQGFLFVFDRVTGKPVSGQLKSARFPKSDMPGEESWPTQPFPTVLPPFSRQKFTEDDVNPYISDPKELAKFKAAIAKSKNLGSVHASRLDGHHGGSWQQRRG